MWTLPIKISGSRLCLSKAQFSQGTVLEVYPNNVYAYLDSVSEKVMDVDTRVIGIPASDFTLSKREVIPANVTVKGATHRINEMARVVAPVDVSERENDFQVESTLIAMNQKRFGNARSADHACQSTGQSNTGTADDNC